MLEFLERHKRKREVRRLEAIKEDFLKEYRDLCTKYNAQLVARAVSLSNDTVKITQQLDVYYPELIQKVVDTIAGKTNGQQEESK